MVILETSIFTKQIQMFLSDDEYRLLQAMLVERPDSGVVIPHSGGLRKIRWSAKGHGKSGGVRAIYYWLVSDERILMLFLYPKNIQDNLTPQQIKVLRQIIEEEYHGR
jgi:mRNA-degrading endonuclease RelE of RelBE toxin-antitoxin system